MEQDNRAERKNSPEARIKVKFTVFGKPIPKARPRVTRNHTYTPARTENQETKVALVYKSLYHGFKFKSGVPLRLEADFYIGVPKSDSKKVKVKKLAGEIRPIIRNGDVDNYLKLVSDACNGIVYEDDSQIVEMVGRKFYSDKPRTEIIIKQIGGVNGGDGG